MCITILASAVGQCTGFFRAKRIFLSFFKRLKASKISAFCGPLPSLGPFSFFKKTYFFMGLRLTVLILFLFGWRGSKQSPTFISRVGLTVAELWKYFSVELLMIPSPFTCLSIYVSEPWCSESFFCQFFKLPRIFSLFRMSKIECRYCIFR